MPEYYLPKSGGGGGMSSKTLLLIVIGVIVLLLIGVFALILIRSGQPSTADIATSVTPTPVAPVVVEEPEEVDEEPEVEAEEEPEEEVISETIEEASTSINLPSVGLATVQSDTDTDQDGLTDAEEQIFSTSAAVPDTDSDNFLDGAEVANLYDPALAGALLEVSPQIKVARNATQGYQFLIPALWTTTSLTPTGEEFIIRTNDGTESFTINIYPNEDRMTPVQWYQDQEPAADLNQFNNFSNEAGWNGIQSIDGRVVIAVFGSTEPGARAFVYVMHYDVGSDNLLRFPSIWEMMLQSLTLLEPEQLESGGQ